MAHAKRGGNALSSSGHVAAYSKTEVYWPFSGSGPAGKLASGNMRCITPKAEDVTQSQI